MAGSSKTDQHSGGKDGAQDKKKAGNQQSKKPTAAAVGEFLLGGKAKRSENGQLVTTRSKQNGKAKNSSSQW